MSAAVRALVEGSPLGPITYHRKCLARLDRATKELIEVQYETDYYHGVRCFHRDCREV